MMKHPITRLIYIAAPTGATFYGIHRGLSHLEEKYPNLPASDSASKALLVPKNPKTQHCAYADIFAARIPMSALEARTQPAGKQDQISLEEAWARSVLGSRVLRTEASILGLFSRMSFSPGDIGAQGFGAGPDDKPQELLNGVAYTQRAPGADADSQGLLIAWYMADEPRLFFEKIARWGYPWRLMSGGRHEMSVSQPYEVPGQGRVVDVRFAAAHDYEIVEEEGVRQKIIPAWVMRLHAGYSRLILDLAVREVVDYYEKANTRG
ncbi:uncharacterized protein N7496_004949 [Penicillium cataractarum]|uniref:Uncharacterized protein n=1 Tax=Penicillium cataractarum TaxID=2100454 RepID=A0A9W9SFN8_9EURO|nr:uncharacterized protein N7496_004949 [Penicillium cataractarum]KAJ5377540.1 hypothetical protein N7496_004949 [Penicillium cataractarum]